MSSSTAVMVPRKYAASVAKDKEDHISNLPDDVINIILSKLSTVEAVATSVLSKDWKYKWTSIRHIEINDDRRWSLPTGGSTLIRFLESLILHMETVRSASLELENEYDSNGLETVISELLETNNVEKLHINTTQKLMLPDTLFNSTSLKDIVLIKGPFFKIPSNNCFVSLTSLCLCGVTISNEVLDEDYKNFALNFPVLENLELSYCIWDDVRYSNIHIFAPALKTFMSEHDDAEFYNIVIHDAKLADFTIKGCQLEAFYLTGTQVECASLLFVSYGRLVMDWSVLRIRRLLKEIAPNLEKLSVSGYVAQAILESKQGHPRVPRFDKLRTLIVVDGQLADRRITNAGTVFEILHAAPFLEYLDLDVNCWHKYDYDAVESVPWCITNSLEEISLYDIMGSDDSLELAKFLLKTAAKLKVFGFSTDLFGVNHIQHEEVKDIISGYPTASVDVKLHIY